MYDLSSLRLSFHSHIPGGRFPIGVTAPEVCFTGPLTKYLSPEWFITLGNILMIGAMILFCCAEAPDKYWRFGFTSLGISSAGAMLAYAHSKYALFPLHTIFTSSQLCSIAMFASTPPGMVGAIFNCGCQLGAAVGLAVDLSIETSVEQRHGGYTGFSGRRAAFYWQITAVAIEGLAVLIFYDTGKSAGRSGSHAVAEGEKTRSEETFGRNRKGDALERKRRWSCILMSQSMTRVYDGRSLRMSVGLLIYALGSHYCMLIEF